MRLGSKKTPSVTKLTKHSSLKEYFLDLFAARMNKASEDELLKMSIDCGRNITDAKNDIDRVENLFEAVDIFLSKALMESAETTN